MRHSLRYAAWCAKHFEILANLACVIDLDDIVDCVAIIGVLAPIVTTPLTAKSRLRGIIAIERFCTKAIRNDVTIR